MIAIIIAWIGVILQLILLVIATKQRDRAFTLLSSVENKRAEIERIRKEIPDCSKSPKYYDLVSWNGEVRVLAFFHKPDGTDEAIVVKTFPHNGDEAFAILQAEELLEKLEEK